MDFRRVITTPPASMTPPSAPDRYLTRLPETRTSPYVATFSNQLVVYGLLKEGSGRPCTGQQRRRKGRRRHLLRRPHVFSLSRRSRSRILEWDRLSSLSSFPFLDQASHRRREAFSPVSQLAAHCAARQNLCVWARLGLRSNRSLNEIEGARHVLITPSLSYDSRQDG
jgi:hypothetical protein